MNRKLLFSNEIKECGFSLEDLSGVSLYSKINSDPKEKRLYVSLNYIKSIKAPIKPLGIDIINKIYPFGRYNNGKSQLLKNIGGRVYIDITDFFIFPIKNTIIDIINKNMYKDIKEELICYIKNNNISKRRYSGKIATNLFKIISSVKKNGKKKLRSRYKPECDFEINLIIEGIIDEIQKELIEINDSKMIVPYDFNFKSHKECLIEKIEFIRRRIECVKILIPHIISYIIEYLGPYVYCSINSYNSLRDIVGEENIDLIDQLKNGFNKSINGKMRLNIGKLADLIRDKEDIIEILRENPDKAHNLILEKNYDELNESLEKFLEVYGLRGKGEIDISNSRYEDDFSYISELILDNISNLEKDEIKIRADEYTHQAEKCEKIILNHFNKRHKIKNNIENLKAYAFAEEYLEYALMKVFKVFRGIIYEGAQVLLEEDLIEEKDDAAYLEIDEILYAMINNKNLKEIIKKRKEKYKIYNNLILPKFISSSREIY